MGRSLKNARDPSRKLTSIAAMPFSGSKTKYAAFGIEIGKGTSSNTLTKPGPENCRAVAPTRRPPLNHLAAGNGHKRFCNAKATIPRYPVSRVNEQVPSLAGSVVAKQNPQLWGCCRQSGSCALLASVPSRESNWDVAGCEGKFA